MKIDIAPLQARLERIAFSNNVEIINFANIENFNENFAKDFSRAVVLGQPFENNLMQFVGEDIFMFHMKHIKNYLENIAYRLFYLLQIEGYSSLIIPACSFEDSSNVYSSINKRNGQLAGIGWIGENEFFISPVYGPKIILCSILTNAPLEVDKEYKINLCKECGICKKCDYMESVINCPYGKDKRKE